MPARVVHRFRVRAPRPASANAESGDAPAHAEDPHPARSGGASAVARRRHPAVRHRRRDPCHARRTVDRASGRPSDRGVPSPCLRCDRPLARRSSARGQGAPRPAGAPARHRRASVAPRVGGELRPRRPPLRLPDARGPDRRGRRRRRPSEPRCCRGRARRRSGGGAPRGSSPARGPAAPHRGARERTNDGRPARRPGDDTVPQLPRRRRVRPRPRVGAPAHAAHRTRSGTHHRRPHRRGRDARRDAPVTVGSGRSVRRGQP